MASDGNVGRVVHDVEDSVELGGRAREVSTDSPVVPVARRLTPAAAVTRRVAAAAKTAAVMPIAASAGQSLVTVMNSVPLAVTSVSPVSACQIVNPATAAASAAYLLDEPSSGLDPLMEIVFQEVVRELRNAGRTVLLSSHILAEVEALCDRVTIIRAGRAAETGTFDELRHLTRTTVVVETAEPIGTLSDLPGVHDLNIDDTHAQFSVDTGELNHILERLVELDVRSLTSSPPTLEELFMRHYGDDIAIRHDAEPVEAR